MTASFAAAGPAAADSGGVTGDEGGVTVVGGGGTPHAGELPQATQGPSTGPGGRMTPQAKTVPQAQALRKASDFPVQGVDVASHQGNVNWAKVKGAGITFAYVKATEASSYYNPYFDQQYGGAKARGLYAGAYVFARPDGNAAAQARYFYNHAQFVRDGKTLPLMLDMEGPYPGLKVTDLCWNRSKAGMVKWIKTFVSTVKHRTGMPMLIYTNNWWWSQCTGNSTQFGSEYLNTANWSSTEPTTIPPSWTRWTVWQYTSTGSVPGIDGNVDRDVFNGTRRQLQQLALVNWATSGLTPVWTGSRYHVFGHNSKGRLLQAVSSGSKWRVQRLGGVTRGTPGVTYHSGRYDVFAVSQSGSLFHKAYRGEWSGWNRIARGWATSGVSAVWTGSTYHVFGHDSDGRLLHAMWTGSTWKVGNLGGVTWGTPGVTYHSGRYDVFAASQNGSLLHKAYRGKWSGWNSIARGWATSGVSAVWTGPRYHVFGHGSVGQVLHAVWTGSRWPVGTLGGVTRGTPGVSHYPGRYDVFAVSSNGTLFRSWYSGDWSAWHKVA